MFDLSDFNTTRSVSLFVTQIMHQINPISINMNTGVILVKVYYNILNAQYLISHY